MNKIRGFEIAKKNIDTGELWYIEKHMLPNRATKNSAGYDFRCAENITIPSIWSSVNSIEKIIASAIKKDFSLNKYLKGVVEPTLIHTGVKAYMQEDEVLYLYNRSGNPRKLGLILANGVGVVDRDYYSNENNDGEIMFQFYNFLPYSVTIHKGDKIGQGVFQKYLKSDNDISTSKTRKGGFGSTDEK